MKKMVCIDVEKEILEKAEELCNDVKVEFLQCNVRKLPHREMFNIVTPVQLNHYFKKADRIAAIKNCHDDWICVVEAEGSVIAYLSIEVHHEQEDYIYLDDLSVSEKYRNSGIGTKLIKTAEKFAEDIDIHQIVFHVEKSNTSAFRLYERLGYSVLRDGNFRLFA